MLIGVLEVTIKKTPKATTFKTILLHSRRTEHCFAFLAENDSSMTGQEKDSPFFGKT